MFERFASLLSRAHWARAVLTLRRQDQDRVAAVWGEAAALRADAARRRPTGWLTSPEVLRGYVFPQFEGGNWFEQLRLHYCEQARERCLSLCCGGGELERQLTRSGVCRTCEGIDISPAAIAVARQQAEAEGMSTLTYRVGDVERIRLPRENYDLVVGWMALHHLRGLRRVFRQIARSLRSRGVFVVNEYVGPARFQMPARQVELVSRWLRALPAELKRTETGEIREQFTAPTVKQVQTADPSEAVRSDRILPLLRKHFHVLEQTDYGGGLLHPLLQGVMQSFDPDNRDHRAWLERLFLAEREAMQQGSLASDFSFVVAGRIRDHQS